ncbi:ABC transporter permease [bacterium]|nr:ABC transporter permease [bacterium]
MASAYASLSTASGADNVSLLLALFILVFLITVVSGWFGLQGGSRFFSWQNLMNSLAQAIVIVGLLAIGETVVIIAGGLDISVGSVASIGSVVSASVLAGVGTVGSLAFFPTDSVLVAVIMGILAGMVAGALNGFIVTVLRVNPIIATLGTLAAFAGIAFLLAPDGKPIGVVTQPAFTNLARGRLFQDWPIPALNGSDWTGVPILTVIFVAVTAVFHVLMTYTAFGRAIYAIGGNETAARLAGINLTRIRVTMYMLSGGVAGLAGVLLTARTTSGNPINGVGLELQAITAVFLGGAATTGGKGTIIGTFLAVIIVGILNNGMNLLGFNTFVQRVALGLLLSVRWRSRSGGRPAKRRPAPAPLSGSKPDSGAQHKLNTGDVDGRPHPAVLLQGGIEVLFTGGGVGRMAAYVIVGTPDDIRDVELLRRPQTLLPVFVRLRLMAGEPGTVAAQRQRIGAANREHPRIGAQGGTGGFCRAFQVVAAALRL